MSIKFVLNLTAGFALGACLSSPSAAQQTSPASPDASATNQSQSAESQDPQTNKEPNKTEAPSDKSPDASIQDTKQENKPSSGTSNDRLFFALPNFLTLENSAHVPPLTTKQKFGVVARGSFDPVVVVWYGFLSGISQAENSEPGFGEGAQGYGKRYGASFADGTIENFMTGAIFPTVLRQDPRYFQMGQGNIAHRTFYAMSRNLVTRSDSGKHQFNFSEIVGGALAAAISTYSYHPKGQYISTPAGLEYIASDRTLSNTAKVWGTQYGYDTLTLVVREFWPDIRRAMAKNKSKSDSKVGAAQGE